MYSTRLHTGPGPQLLHKEEKHIKDALQRSKYPIWLLDWLKIKSNHKINTTKTHNNTINNNNDTNSSNNYYSNIQMVVPYIKDLVESFKNICGKLGIQVHFMGGNTIKSLLVVPMDKDNITQKSGVIYRHKCDRLECDEEYKGQSAKTFWERLKGYLRAHSPSITMPTPEVIIPGWTTSPLWVWSHLQSQGLSSTLCISGPMIHPSTGTLGSFSCPTSGMRSCSTSLTSNLNKPFQIFRCSLCIAHTPSWWEGSAGGLTPCVNTLQHWIGMWSCIRN